MTKRVPTFPQKINHEIMVGQTNCDRVWTWDAGWMPTDGSGNDKKISCTPVFPSTRTVTNHYIDSSNDIAYMQGANPSGTPYSLITRFDPTAFFNYESDLATYGAGNTRMDYWKRYYVDNVYDKYGFKWYIQLDDIFQEHAYPAPSGDFGLAEYKTPGYDTPNYTPPVGYCKSYESVWGPAFTYIEQNCNKNFMGYTSEAIYPNALMWLYGRTNYWVMVKDYSGWTSNSGYELQYNNDTGVSNVWGSYYGGTDPNPKFNYCDEITTEYLWAGCPGKMVAWLEQLKKYPTPSNALGHTRIGVNIDIRDVVTGGSVINHALVTAEPSGANSQPYWAPANMGTTCGGMTVSRCWWENLYMTQLLNWMTEKYGPFDSFIYCPATPMYPGNDTPDDTWYLDKFEHLYLTNTVNRINMAVG